MKTNLYKIITTLCPVAARLLIVTLLLSAAWTRAAETGVQAWEQRYSNVADSVDQAQKVVTDNAGNVIVAGSTDDSITGPDMLVIKYSGAGVPLWTNRYNGPGNGVDYIWGMTVDGSGNVFVTGPSVGSGSGYDYATIKYSGAGVPLWTNRYNGSGNGDDYAGAVAVDGSGNVFVTGSSVGSGSSSDYATIKYSGAGVPLWTNRYNGPGNGNDSASTVAVDGSGNVFVTGSSVGSGSSSDYATIKYSGAGVPLWTNRYNGPENSDDYVAALAVDGSGNVFVTGVSYGSGGFGSDYATIAYSGAGVPLWTNRYDGPGNSNDYAYNVAVDGSGNVFVTGQSSDGYSSDYATIKYSGAGVPLWTNRYNGPGNSFDYANAVAVDGSGNVFVTGSSVGSGSSNDFATIKYSGAGAPLWTNCYNGPGNGDDQAYAVAVDGSGNVFVTGSSVGSGSSSDYATIKYSGAGAPLWTNRYNGPGNGNDFARAVAVDGSGNVFVTGDSWGDYATIKYSGAGVPLWTNRYNGPGNSYDQAYAVAVDGSGNVFVTGYSTDSGGLFYDYATIKYSGAGVPLWTNRYNGPRSYDYARAVAVDGSGNVFVTGYSVGSDFFYDYATIAYSGAGVPLWTNRYNGPLSANDYALAVAVDGSGNVFVTGYSVGIGGGGFSDYATIKYSGAGVPLWTNRYNGPGNGNDIASTVAVDGSGNVFVTGSSVGSGSSNDFATIKYSGAGAPLWTNRYNGPGNGVDIAFAVAVDGSGNVFVTGYSFGSGSFSDYATIKYSNAGVPLWTNRYNGPANGHDFPQTKQSLALGPDGAVYVTGSSDGDYGVNTIPDFVTIKYISVPLLDIERSASDVIVSWPSAFSDFTLQACTDLVTTNWSNVGQTPADDGTTKSVTAPAFMMGNRFYRLQK